MVSADFEIELAVVIEGLDRLSRGFGKVEGSSPFRIALKAAQFMLGSFFCFGGNLTQRLMHYLYILCSEKSGRYYVGQTQNVKNRLSKHNKGHSEATKNGIPWGLKKV